MRTPTHVMGFPLPVPQEQDVLNMGICLLTSTPLFFFLREETTHWGMGKSGRELRDCSLLSWLLQITRAAEWSSSLV